MRRLTPLDHPKPAYTRLFTLMGEALRFETNDPHLLEAANESFGRFPAGETNDPNPLVLRLFTEDARYPEPEGARPKPVFHPLGHLLYYQFGPNDTAVIDLRAGIAFGHVSPQTAQDRRFVCANFIETMGQATLSLARGFAHIHAACVVKDGVTLVLTAATGTGKSTLTYACARRGYRVLTEDMVQVKVRPEGVTLWGMPWRLHLLPSVKLLYPELANLEPVQVNREWKLVVDLEARFPNSTMTHADPGLVVLLTRGEHGATHIEPVSRAEALTELEVVWPWEIGWTDEMEQGAARVVGGAYRLFMNGSPDEAVDALDTLAAANAGGNE